MPTDAERTHYQVLGVGARATPGQIRDAHRQLARLLHPDRLSGATDPERRLAERRMREVNVAWTTLSDATRRADYDRMLRARATGPTGSGAPFGGGASGPGSARGYGAEPGSGATDPRTGRPVHDDDDPDEFYARLRAAELDPDEEPLAGWHFWLLRRGPIIAAVLVGLFLFVATAYAGGGGTADDATPSSVSVRNCVRITDGRTAVRVDCASDNDGRIVTEVARARECPDRTTYVVLDTRFVCVTDDPSVTGDVPASLGG